MKRSIRRLLQDTQGQDLVEYALACGLVAVMAVGTFPQLTSAMSKVFSMINVTIQNNVH
jgi:pilus assembly protein Flp/PilA